MLTKDNLNEALADAVMDRPREFFIDNRRFCLWSPSLGMSIMLSRNISELGINKDILRANPMVEALRIVTKYPEKVCRILAIHSLRTFRLLSDTRKIDERTNYFLTKLALNELSGLLISILNEPTAENFISLSGLDKQREKQAQIAKVKKDKSHTLTFGGLTYYGSLIAPAIESLHMSFHDVVWGISLVNLRMLLADKINSMYLSDEEAKALGLAAHSTETYGMTPEDIAKLMAMDCWE